MDLEGSVLKILKLITFLHRHFLVIRIIEIIYGSLNEDERRQKGKKTNFIPNDTFFCGKLESYSH